MFKKAQLPIDPITRNRLYFQKLSERLKNRTMREILLVASQEKITIKIKGSGRFKRLIQLTDQKDQYLAELR